MSFTDIYSITGSAMTAQTVRLNTVASNLANADAVSANPEDAYKALKPVFATVYQKNANDNRKWSLSQCRSSHC